MTRCLLIFLFSLSSFANAGSIRIAQWMPWNFVVKSQVPKDIQFSYFRENMVLDLGELKPALTFQLSLAGQMKDIQFQAGGLSARHVLSARINVQRFSIDQILRREVAGNVFNIRIQGECSPFSIEVPGFHSLAQLSFVPLNQSYSPDLDFLHLQTPQWKVETIQCTGIGNLGEEIARQVASALNDPGQFEDMLTVFAGSEIKSTFSTFWTSLLNSSGQELIISGLTRPSAKGFFVLASLPVSQGVEVSLPDFDEQSFPSDSPQLLMSQKGFETLLEERINKMVPRDYNLQQIQGFRDLMSSRFKQYLVWPDLQRFPKNQAFYFSTDPTNSQLILKKDSSGTYTAWLNTNGVLRTIMGGSPIDYILFGLGLKTQLGVSVKEGELSLSTSSEADLNLAWNYGLLYQMLYQPQNRIAVDILKNSIAGFFKNQTVKEPLPAIKVGDRTYKLGNWKQTNDLITMDWQ